jgi:hypothetical protein
VLVTIAVFSVSYKTKGMYKVIFTLVLAVASLMGLHAQEFQVWCTSQNQYGGFKSRMEGNKNMTRYAKK